MCVITYNQKEFISNCLDSVLEQRLNDNYNIIVCDDSSTDGTSKLLTENYSRFKNVCNHINRENIGVSNNFLKCINQSNAKYIAICEGDDFWNDPFKLQKQVEILEKNPDCSFCFTDVKTLENDKITGIHPNLGSSKHKFTGIELADQPGSIAQTCSLVIRKQYLEKLPDWVLKSYTLDWCLQLYFSKFGPAIYIPEVTATYRIHEKGIWSKLSAFGGWRKNLAFYKTALRQLPNQISQKRLQKRIQKTVIDALELANIQANKTEIHWWLWQKFTTCPLVSVKQTLHSLRLLLA
ncbi:glycosyltransferase [Opitutales bacterium]|nr:glycosyltransferase [Opitutales bacterium]